MSVDLYYKDAISFWKSGKIVQMSEKRFEEDQFLSAPIIYLFRHSAELLLKGLIIRDSTEQYELDIYEVKLPPYNMKLYQMHSLKALVETWIFSCSALLFSSPTSNEFEEMLSLVERIDKCDPVSTYFRYPYSKSGNNNSRAFVSPITDDILSQMPCSIGSVVAGEGKEHFSCWHGEEHIAWLEIELNNLVEMLSRLYCANCQD